MSETWRDDTPEGIEALIAKVKELHEAGRIDIGLITFLHEHYMDKIRVARNEAFEQAAAILDPPEDEPLTLDAKFGQLMREIFAARIRLLKEDGE